MFLFGIFNMLRCAPCLPPDIKEDSVVKVIQERSPNGALVSRQVTVKQTLQKLQAKCRKGILVDGDEKPIRFFKVQGCWGNPPADYLEVLERQRKELQDLKKSFTVIEMQCNTDGMPLRSIL